MAAASSSASVVPSDYAGLFKQYVSPGAVTDDYEIDVRHKLGSGGYASVYSGRNKTTGAPVAIKVLKRFDFRRPGVDEVTVLREVGFMRLIAALGSPFLLGAHSAYEYVFDQHRLCIVTPLCEGGDLFERIAGMGRYTERVAAQRFAEMMRGIDQLHKAGVLHRDLKPENLLLSSSKDGEACAVLADFGLSEHLELCAAGKGPTGTQLVGTLAYNAPEHLSSTPMWSPAGDVWAAGVVLFIMLSGSPPFYVNDRLAKHVHDATLRKVIREGKFVFYPSLFDSVSAPAKDLISGMLQVDPSKRLTVEQCLAHPWLADHDAIPDVHLAANQKQLRSFNGRRRFRAAAVACRWGLRSTMHSELFKLVGDTEFSEDHIRAISAAFRSEISGGDASASALVDGAMSIGRPEFEKVMGELGFGGLPLDRMWELFDVDGNGGVDLREVLCGLATLRNGGEEALRLCFDILDVDGNGHLDENEMAIAITALSGAGEEGSVDAAELAEHLEYAFEYMDIDKDGRISLEEFKAGIEKDPSLVAMFIRPLDKFGGDSSRALLSVTASSPSPSPVGSPSG
jgi:calcium-dependent protein kinase